MPVDQKNFRRALATFATGVTVVTAKRPDGGHIGVTVNSLCSVSLEPPLILWCLKRNSYRFAHFATAENFNVNILAADQKWLSSRFAGSRADRFEDIPHACRPGGAPLITGCAAHLECRTETIYPGGDHGILLGEVENLNVSGRPALLLQGGKYLEYMETGPNWFKLGESGRVEAGVEFG